MKRKTRGIPENREVHPGTGYIQRTLQATLTIWFILTVVIIAAFGLSETLRVAGITRGTNLLITFIFSLGLILLVLLLPGSFFTLKEANKADSRKRYIQQVLQSLSIIWAILAAIIIAAIGLYSLLRVAGIARDTNLLITFIFSLVLNLIALWLVPKALLTLKGEESDYDKSSA